jgi:hypothetical protein
VKKMTGSNKWKSKQTKLKIYAWALCELYQYIRDCNRCILALLPHSLVVELSCLLNKS